MALIDTLDQLLECDIVRNGVPRYQALDCRGVQIQDLGRSIGFAGFQLSDDGRHFVHI